MTYKRQFVIHNIYLKLAHNVWDDDYHTDFEFEVEGDEYTREKLESFIDAIEAVCNEHFPDVDTHG